jgi:hypothetical protein
MGVTHSTVSGGGVFGGVLLAMFLIAACARFAWATAPKAIKAPIQTAYVLPAPVVACSRPDTPAAIAFDTSFWNLKGFQPRSTNQLSSSRFML